MSSVLGSLVDRAIGIADIPRPRTLARFETAPVASLGGGLEPRLGGHGAADPAVDGSDRASPARAGSEAAPLAAILRPRALTRPPGGDADGDERLRDSAPPALPDPVAAASPLGAVGERWSGAAEPAAPGAIEAGPERPRRPAARRHGSAAATAPDGGSAAPSEEHAVDTVDRTGMAPAVREAPRPRAAAVIQRAWSAEPGRGRSDVAIRPLEPPLRGGSPIDAGPPDPAGSRPVVPAPARPAIDRPVGTPRSAVTPVTAVHRPAAPDPSPGREPPDWPDGLRSGRREPPIIRVSIGRIEVRAVAPPTRPTRQPAPTRGGTPSLEDYLRARSGRR